MSHKAVTRLVLVLLSPVAPAVFRLMSDLATDVAGVEVGVSEVVPCGALWLTGSSGGGPWWDSVSCHMVF